MPSRRPPKPDPVFAAILGGSWKPPAMLAVGSLLVVYVLFPLVAGGDSILDVIGVAVVPFGWFFALLFGALALMRVREGRRVPLPSAGPVAFVEPPTVLPDEQAGGTPGQPVRAADRGDRLASPVTTTERPREWSTDVLARMEWKRFEDLCCAFYREKGIPARTTPLGPDGGIDIHLYQDPDDAERPTAIVQCQASVGPLDVRPVSELRALMEREGVAKAFFMAPGGFTEAARAFAATERIVLLDGRLFLAMLQRLPADASRRLLEFATEGEWTVPTCPNCGVKLVARRGPSGTFWGCRLYPNCRYEMAMGPVEALALH